MSFVGSRMWAGQQKNSANQTSKWGSNMKVSVLIPSYRRPDDLLRCLGAFKPQLHPADEIVVVHRPDDAQTIAVLERPEFRDLPLKPTIVTETGVVAALNMGISACTGDIVCITDDDAAPHTDWIQRIVTHFENDPTIYGIGGRDVVHRFGKEVTGRKPVVGRIQFFGRDIGNHHLGFGDVRDVDLLKGANMSYRLAEIARVGFDTRLKGTGAQVANDMKVSLDLKKQGYRMIYDPQVRVDHFPAVRHDEDQRSSYSALAVENRSHNVTLTILDFLPRRNLPFFILWAFAVGSQDEPGVIRSIMLAASRKPAVGLRFFYTLKGRVSGIRTWLGGSSAAA